jgi:hypothetical protein
MTRACLKSVVTAGVGAPANQRRDDDVDGPTQNGIDCQSVATDRPRTGRPSIKTFIRIGIDSAKSFFQVHAIEPEGRPRVTRKEQSQGALVLCVIRRGKVIP